MAASDHRELKPFRNMVRPRHIANLCGQPYTEVDIVNVGTELGLTRGYGYYERREARPDRRETPCADIGSRDRVAPPAGDAKLADQSEEEATR